MSIEWGPEIPVNGARLIWLADDSKWQWTNGSGFWHTANFTPSGYIWSEIRSIRLPADHWAYPVIAQGFEPWAGGDEPPEDWNRGDVLTNGENAIIPPYEITCWKTRAKGFSIIGYKKRTEPAEQPEDDGDYVRVKRMTRAEWMTEAYYGNTIAWAEKQGIIPELTPLERFTRDNPDWRDKSVEEAVKLALEWRE